MSRNKKKYKPVEQETQFELERINKGGYTLDFNLADEQKESLGETPVDFSVSKELVVVDSTKRHLTKMRSSSYLSAEELQQKRIIHPNMDDYSVINSFREIRTHLLQKAGKKNFVLMVVSLAQNMGATFTSINLGAAFSYEGEKTSLIIDCNQHQSKLDKVFDTEVTYGLTDYLDQPEIGVSNIIYPTGVNRMRFIPIGLKKNTEGELLSSEHMREFVGVLKRRYTDRYIILNAPPLEVSADAAILSELADYIVVVVPYGRVTRDRMSKAAKLLPKEKVIGTIMNNKKNYV